jgi:spermidine/putrescine transport system substrate-binding protein
MRGQERWDQARQAGDIDPAVMRGLPWPRLSRREVLGYGGAGVLGLAALVSGCGVRNATVTSATAGAGGAGSPSWWAGQKLHNVVNFGNWPYYIDVLGRRHPSLDHFTGVTGIKVNYTEPISDNLPFYTTIRPPLEAGLYTGYDVIVMTTNSPALGYLINNGWLTPLDRAMMTNFKKYASPLVTNPSWDPGNKYTMAWQSGYTAIGYNSSVIKNPAPNVGVLFDKRFSGKVGMMADPQELGSLGLLAIGVEPATSTEPDWAKAATRLRQQRTDGIVRGYYNQDYITHLKNGDTFVSQAWSGDIFQADLSRSSRNLQLLIPDEGAMHWTDNMCIPRYARNPKDAMALMDYYYQPQVAAVVEYYDDYVCPVPAAKQMLLHPTGWAAQELAAMHKSIGLPTSKTADSPVVFPDARLEKLSKNYYTFKSQEELTAWNNLFVPITQGA